MRFIEVFSLWVLCSSGKTTLSASGMLLPDALYSSEAAKRVLNCDSGQSLALVVTVASVVEPFLSAEHRENMSQVEDVVDWILVVLFIDYVSTMLLLLFCFRVTHS